MANATQAARVIDLGNNESATLGVVATDGGFLALTFTASKMFKTQAGAARWIARRVSK